MIALFFDTETTGVRSYKDPNFVPKLVQIGAILQDLGSGRVLAEVNLLNKDCGPVPQEATNIHGITDEMTKEYGLAIAGIDRLFSRLSVMADILVAHNFDYDHDVIKDNMPESREAVVNKPYFCTMDNNLYLVQAPLTDKQRDYYTSRGPKYRSDPIPFKVPSLVETYQHYFDEGFAGAHDAMADIRATKRIFIHMLTEGLFEANAKAKLVPSKNTARKIRLAKNTRV